MNLRAASLVFVALWSFSALPASACRFCNAGPDMDRYTTTDPMNAVPFDALVNQYSDKAPPVPKPEEIVTSKAALAQAAASATPQPGAELAPITPNSYRSRLLGNASVAPAVAATGTTPAATAPSGQKANALGEWTSRAVDVALLGTLVGVGLFFGRGARRQTA